MNRFFNKISEKTGLDSKYFIKNFLVILIRDILTTLIGLVMGMIFARYVTKDVYGNYQLVLSFIATFGFLTLPGFNKGGIWSDAATDKDGSIDIVIKTQIRWSFLGTLILFCIGLKYYMLNDNPEIALGLLVAGFTFPLAIGGDIWQQFLESKKEYELVAKLYLGFTIVSKIAIITAIFAFPNSLVAILIASLGTAMLGNLTGLIIARKFKKNNESSEDLRHYGMFLTKISILRTLVSKIDQLMVGIFLGPVQLAIYSFAEIIPEQIKMMIGNVANILIPKIVENSQSDVQKKISQQFLGILLVSTLSIGICIALTPLAITILFTEDYAESIIYSQIITAGMIVYVFEVIFSKIILVKKHKQAILVAQIITPLGRVVSVTIGFIALGMLGVAIGTVGARIIAFLTYMYVARKTSNSH